MEEMFQYIASGILLYAFSRLFDSIVNPPYPEGARLELLQVRFKIYNNLYYIYCYDFQNGRRINKQQLGKLTSSMLSFYYSQYLKQKHMSELLSANMQRKLRKFAVQPSVRNLQLIREQISNDYRVICRELRYSVCAKYPNKYDAIFYTLAIVEAILYFATFLSFYLRPDISISLLGLNILIFIIMAAISSNHFGAKF